ncbi:transposase [Limosilactobacillus reuteri]|uniref:Transposase n=1 Tax=Limosilactobacillus reuteri TaxID=1598 RepID=A0A2S1ET60_LIMRT|nr:transposase [Limosilactobacillus reuteri]
MDPVFVKKGPSFMNNSIRTILGVKDPYLKLDEKNFDNPIEDQPNQIIVHLIQTYHMHCPRCGQLMCKNGYKTVNCLGPELHFKPTIWSIKKQKYICKASSSCPEVITN